MIRWIFTTVLTICLVGVAQADMFSSVITWAGNGQYIGEGQTLTYSHSLLLATPPVSIPLGDLVTSAALNLKFHDDEPDQGGNRALEFAWVELDDIGTWGWTEVDNGPSYPIAVDVAWLNDDGILKVEVTINNSDSTWADAYLKESDLSGQFTPAPIHAPVPAAVLLGMLGLGVAGVKLRSYA